MSRKKGLGRGLEALLGDINADLKFEDAINNSKTRGGKTQLEGLAYISINELDTNPEQARKKFDKDKIEELAQSIKQSGIIQPIIVKPHNDRYSIIAGERRYRAARIVGLKEIPAIVRDYSETEVIEISLIENLQRENLNPIEESRAFFQLMEINELTQEELSAKLGKSRSAIANSLRLLRLREEIHEMLIDGVITSGHARALLSVEDRDRQLEIAQIIVKKDLSVRDTEKLCKQKPEDKKEKIIVPVELKHAARSLQDMLETKVNISGDGSRGQIKIEYYSAEQLEQLYEYLSNK